MNRPVATRCQVLTLPHTNYCQWTVVSFFNYSIFHRIETRDWIITRCPQFHSKTAVGFPIYLKWVQEVVAHTFIYLMQIISTSPRCFISSLFSVADGRVFYRIHSSTTSVISVHKKWGIKKTIFLNIKAYDYIYNLNPCNFRCTSVSIILKNRAYYTRIPTWLFAVWHEI